MAFKLLMAAFLVGAAATSIQGSASRRTSLDGSLPLQTISFDESQSVGTVGTGCTWLGGTNRTRRVSMADDRAAVKLAGRVLTLQPAKGALEVFPFTYLRWTGPELELSIRDTKQVVKKGGEYVETVAWLDLYEKGGKRTWRGRLNCGS